MIRLSLAVLLIVGTRIPASADETKYRYFEDGSIAEMVVPAGPTYTFAQGTVPGNLASASPNFLPMMAASASDPLDQSNNRVVFTGFLYERELSLYLSPSGRLYDPALGRFIQQDSVIGEVNDPPSLHRYLYANANPRRYVDPTGHESANAGCYYGPSSCPGQSATLSAPEMALSDTAAWSLGSALRTGFETARGIVNLIRLNVDPRKQVALAAKLSERAPTAARAAMGDYLAQTELLEPVITSRVQAYEEGVDSYADAKTPVERGWTATGTVFPEASILAGGVAGLVRGSGRALGAVMEEPGAAVAPGIASAGGLPPAGAGYANLPFEAVMNSRGPVVIVEGPSTALGQVRLPQPIPTVTRGASSAASEAVSPQVERLAGPKLEHLNAAIGEVHGYEEALAQGHLPIRAPVKTTARGADYLTFDPVQQEVVFWDAKYRGPQGGSVPKTLSAVKIQQWSAEARRAIGALPDSPVKAAMLRALDAGQVRGEIYKWPK
jgi:RHS repeat-associated protein